MFIPGHYTFGFSRVLSWFLRTLVFFGWDGLILGSLSVGFACSLRKPLFWFGAGWVDIFGGVWFWVRAGKTVVLV